MGLESITEQQVKYLISWKSINYWFLLIQCVLSCVCSGAVFPSSSLEFFLWFLLQNQVPAFPVGCNWEGMKALCSVFSDLDSFGLHLISSKSEPDLGLFLLALQSATQQSLGDFDFFFFLCCCVKMAEFGAREKREAVFFCEGGEFFRDFYMWGIKIIFSKSLWSCKVIKLVFGWGDTHRWALASVLVKRFWEGLSSLALKEINFS